MGPSLHVAATGRVGQSRARERRVPHRATRDWFRVSLKRLSVWFGRGNPIVGINQRTRLFGLGPRRQAPTDLRKQSVLARPRSGPDAQPEPDGTFAGGLDASAATAGVRAHDAASTSGWVRCRDEWGPGSLAPPCLPGRAGPAGPQRRDTGSRSRSPLSDPRRHDRWAWREDRPGTHIPPGAPLGRCWYRPPRENRAPRPER